MPSSRADAPVAMISVRLVYRSSEVDDRERVRREIDLGDVAADDLGAEPLRLRADFRHQLRAIDAVPVARASSRPAWSSSAARPPRVLR